MNPLINAAIFGLLGGLIRASVGILKHFKSNKKTNLKPIYFLTTIIIAAAIGMITSTALSTNYIVNLVVGYAGIDFLESLVKIVKKD